MHPTPPLLKAVSAQTQSLDGVEGREGGYEEEGNGGREAWGKGEEETGDLVLSKKCSWPCFLCRRALDPENHSKTWALALAQAHFRLTSTGRDLFDSWLDPVGATPVDQFRAGQWRRGQQGERERGGHGNRAGKERRMEGQTAKRRSEVGLVWGKAQVRG